MNYAFSPTSLCEYFLWNEKFHLDGDTKFINFENSQQLRSLCVNSYESHKFLPKCSSLLSIVMIKHPLSKTKWGRKGFVPPWKEVRAGTQSKNLESGTEAEDMEEHCLLAFSPQLAQPAPMDWILAPSVQGWHLLQYAYSIHINHQSSNCPIDLPMADTMDETLQLRISLPRCLRFVTSRQKSNQPTKDTKQQSIA